MIRLKVGFPPTPAKDEDLRVFDVYGPDGVLLEKGYKCRTDCNNATFRQHMIAHFKMRLGASKMTVKKDNINVEGFLPVTSISNIHFVNNLLPDRDCVYTVVFLD